VLGPTSIYRLQGVNWGLSKGAVLRVLAAELDSWLASEPPSYPDSAQAQGDRLVRTCMCCKGFCFLLPASCMLHAGLLPRGICSNRGNGQRHEASSGQD